MIADQCKSLVIFACLISTAYGLAAYEVNYSAADTSQWQCRLCEFENYRNTESEFSVSSFLTTEDSDRFGRNGSFARAGMRTAFDIDLGKTWANGWFLNLHATNVGLDSHDLVLKLRASRTLQAYVGLHQYRRVVESDVLSPFRLQQRRLVLASDWRSDFQTTGFSNLEQTNRPIHLGTTRNRLESGISYMPIPRIALSLTHVREEKTGTQETYRDALYQSTALPRKIDHRISTTHLRMEYQSDVVRGAWTAERSGFDNDEPLLSWQSPYSYGPVDNISANASSHRHLTRILDAEISLRGLAKIRIHERSGATKSDARSLPYANNELGSAANPIELRAQRNFHSRKVLVNSESLGDLQLLASHFSYKVDDERVPNLLTPALGGFILSTPKRVRPGSHKRYETELVLSYRTSTGLQLQSTIWTDTFERTKQDILRNNTRAVKMDFVRPLFDKWKLVSSFGRQIRNASAFQDLTANNPRTRRFHQAYMEHDSWSGGVQFTPWTGDDTISLDVDLHRTEFPQSILGLQHRRYQGLVLSYGLQRERKVTLDGYLAFHKRTSSTSGSETFDLSRLWVYSTMDNVLSGALKVTVLQSSERLKRLNFEYGYSDGMARYQTSFRRVFSEFPDLLSDHQSLNFEMKFRAFFDTTITTQIYIEKYDSKDWSIDDVAQSSLEQVLTMNRDRPPYRNILLALRWSNEIH